MRDYGRVHGSFWTSPTTSSLSDTGKMLALYLLTCSHATIAGVFRLPDGYAAEDLGWSSERVAQGFGELSEKGFAERCATTKWVWVRKHLEWNPPENPNQVKSARKVALGVPQECAWICEFSRTCGERLGLPPVQVANPSTTVAATLSKPGAVTGTEAVTGAGAVAGEAPQQAATATPRQPAKRGSRLPEDWQLPAAWEFDAVGEGWSAEAVRLEARKFRNYWVAKSGKDATKLDWRATWDNWLLKVPKAAQAPHLPINRQEALEQRNQTVAQRWAQKHQETAHDA